MENENLYVRYRDIIVLGFISIVIGILVGVFDTVFGKVLLYVTSFREQNAVWLIPILPIAGVVIVTMYDKFGKDSIKGMSLVFEAGHGGADKIPTRLIPLVTVSTWFTHLFGGSAGREGVAIQIGATVAHGVGCRIKKDNKDSIKILLVAGMAAGFAGLFQTPIAAVFFATEVLTAGVLEHRALFPTFIASYTASFTSHMLGLEKFSVNLADKVNLNFTMIFKLVVLGILFGILGGLFADALHLVKNLFTKLFKKPRNKIFIVGIVISAFSLMLHTGRYSGLGTNLIAESFNGNIYSYDFIMKSIFTVVTLGAGFQGGEVTPLFSVGASFGVLMASLMGMPAAFAAALGYAGVFGSATNTLMAPMFIGAEVFGFEYMPYFFVTCMLAYIFNGNRSIYPLQKR